MKRYPDYAEFDFVEWIEFNVCEVDVELPLKIYCEYEAPEPDVRFPGGVTINDILLGDKSVFTQCEAIAEAIHDRIRKIEPYLNEKASEFIAEKMKEDHAAYCDWQYEQMKDRQLERGVA